jgi:LruC domain-containing protein
MATPQIQIINVNEVLLNNSFNIDFNFTNNSYPIGFKPFVNVLLPKGITTDATKIGTWDNINLTWKDSNNIIINEHPYSKYIDLPDNQTSEYSWYIFESSYSSYGPEQPSTTIKSLNCTISEKDGAILDEMLYIKAIPWFRYGLDAEDNGEYDNPIGGLEVVSNITPKLMILTKTNLLPESETVTGINFPFTFRIKATIAKDQELTNLIISDELPDSLVYLSTTNININATEILNLNNITWTFDSIIGKGADDIIIDYLVYVPYKDSSNNLILDEVTGASRQINSKVDASCNLLFTSDTDVFYAKSVAIQKSNIIEGNNVVIPGSTIIYQHDIQVSDYFCVDNVVITDILSDGQLFKNNCVIEYTNNSNNLKSTIELVNDNEELTVYDIVDGLNRRSGVKININLSKVLRNNKVMGGFVNLNNEIGTNNVGGTRFKINYDVEVDVVYESEEVSIQNIDINDHVTNSVDIDCDNVDFINNVNYNRNIHDDSFSKVNIGSVSLDKAMYALNGVLGAHDGVYANDLVTYRLLINLSHQNVQDFVIKDYLPPPIMDVNDFINFENMLQNISSNPPIVNDIQYGPSHTYNNYKTPIISKSESDNSLIFTFGTYQTDMNIGPQIVDILYTVKVSNKPTADGLILTNQCTASINCTKNKPIQLVSTVGIILNQPKLLITKAIVDSTSGTQTNPITFNGIGTYGFESNINILTPDINSNSTGNQGNDTVQYAIVIKNIGHADSYRSTIRDILPDDIINPTNINIVDGSGNLLNLNSINKTDLFTDTGLLIGLIARNNDIGSDTNSVIIITYDATINPLTETGTSLINTVEISDFTNEPDGIKFYNEFLLSDTAIIEISKVTISKTIISTSELHTNNINDSRIYGTIGEYVDYRTVITFPRGTTSNFYVYEETNMVINSSSNCGMELIENSVEYGDLSVDQLLLTIMNNGRYHKFDFGNVTNLNLNQTIIINTRELITDHQHLYTSKTVNSKAIGYYANGNINSNTTKIFIKEPDINIVKTLTDYSPLYPSKDDIIYYKLTVDSTNSFIDAKSFELGDLVPIDLNIIGATIDGSQNENLNIIDRNIKYVVDVFPKNTILDIIVECTINNYRSGDTIINGCGINYETVSDPNLSRSFNKIGWNSIRTDPTLSLSLINDTYDRGLINSNITGTIGDNLISTHKIYFPKGTTNLKNIVIYSNNYKTNQNITFTKSLNLNLNLPSEMTSIENNNTITIDINQIITNNGDDSEYISFIIEHLIWDDSENVLGNLNDIYFVINIENTVGQILSMSSDVLNYYIIEPQLVLRKNIVSMPLHSTDTVTYELVISVIDDIYTMDALNVNLNNIVNLNFNDASFNVMSDDFINNSTYPNMDVTCIKMGKGTSVTLRITKKLDSVAMFDTIVSKTDLMWRSNNYNYREYFVSETNNFILEPSYDKIPMKDDMFTVLFEDALDMDFDYEDLVVNCSYKIYRSKLGIKQINCDFHIVSRGAAFNHTFGLHIPGLNKATGNWNVKTLLNNSIINANSEITNYTKESNLSEFIPVFVSTKDYLPPDDINENFSANVHNRTELVTEWIEPCSGKLIIKFDVPFIKNNIVILPYIDVFQNEAIIDYTHKQYRITLGDVVDYSRKGFGNYPRAIVVNSDFTTGPDNYYSLRDVYPDFASWVGTNPDYSNIRYYANNIPEWATNISQTFNKLNYKSLDYTNINIKNKPNRRQIHHKNIKQLGNTFGTIYDPSNNISYTNIIKITSSDSNIYILSSDGTVLNTIYMNIIDIDAGTNDIACITADLTVVCQLDTSSWVNIYDIAYCGSTLVGLDIDFNLHKVGSSNINLNLNNIVKIGGSVNYLGCIDSDGNTFICDMSGNIEQIWANYDVVEISVSESHCLGLTVDGTVLSFNRDSVDWTNMVSIDAGNGWSVGTTITGNILVDGKVINMDDHNYIDVVAGFDNVYGLYLD